MKTKTGYFYVIDKLKLQNQELAAIRAQRDALLEAAETAVKSMENGGYAWKHGVVELRAAIAKAKGNKS